MSAPHRPIRHSPRVPSFPTPSLAGPGEGTCRASSLRKEVGLSAANEISGLSVIRRNRRIGAPLSFWIVLLAVSGCGYNVGAPFSPEIRSVHVPIFNSGSNRRFLEYQLTEAVQKQIQQRAHFRLVKEEEADTRLTGKIIDLRKNALGQTRNSDARELQVNLQVEMTWEDIRSGKILSQQRVPLPPELLQLAAQAEFAPEVGQSLATADQTAVERLARNIVDMMEMPW